MGVVISEVLPVSSCHAHFEKTPPVLIPEASYCQLLSPSLFGILLLAPDFGDWVLVYGEFTATPHLQSLYW